jgi:NO-binding membrane sensor protein with MHYT domain
MDLSYILRTTYIRVGVFFPLLVATVAVFTLFNLLQGTPKPTGVPVRDWWFVATRDIGSYGIVP